ncbi:8719_t:CDS:2, partial [Cetraspora pellucida]
SSELDDELSNESKDKDSNQSDDDDNDLDIVLDTTYLADNPSAKWNLEDLFILDMVALHYITEVETQEMLRKQKEIEFTTNKLKRIINMEDYIESLVDSDSEKLDKN